MFRIARIAIALAAALFVANAALAASSIRVKVNDQPITNYDIQQRARLLQLVGIKGGEKAATEELIDETLQFIEAAKRGLQIGDSRVDGAIAQIAQSMKLSPEQLAKALLQQGVDIKTLKRRIKAQMIWQQLVQSKMRVGGAPVKSSDITAALLGDSKDKLKTTEYTLQQIVFVVPSGSAAGLFAQRRREAEAFRLRFGGCETAVEQAKQLKGVVVKNLGRRTSQELAGGQGKEVLNTAVGKTTRPSQTDQGIELIAVCSTKTLDSDAEARTEVETKLLMERNKELGKEYLAELRKKALIEYR